MELVLAIPSEAPWKPPSNTEQLHLHEYVLPAAVVKMVFGCKVLCLKRKNVRHSLVCPSLGSVVSQVGPFLESFVCRGLVACVK